MASDGHKFRSLKKALGIFSTVVFPCSRDEPKQTSIFIECHSGYAPKQKATDIVAEETARVHGMGVPWNGVLPARLKEQEQLTYCKKGGDGVHISEYTIIPYNSDNLRICQYVESCQKYSEVSIRGFMWIQFAMVCRIFASKVEWNHTYL